MAEQPLVPFSPPTALFSYLPSGTLSSAALVEWALYLVFAFWAVYTVVAVYHWLRYSHAALIALPMIALHLVVSVSLMSYALSGDAKFLAPYL